MDTNSVELISAAELERRGILRKGTAYRMVKRGLLPHYAVGPKNSGIRFQVDEVLASLRRPAAMEVER